LSTVPLYSASDYLRRHDEGDGDVDPFRSPFRRDYARIIHSPAFRRLQGKTQLFPGIDSDYFRNRLTHSLEVSQIAESIAFKLNSEHKELKESGIDPRVVCIAGLAHDLGHPPFGHNGEKALDECMKQYGGFEGNAQTLRIISTLEKKKLLPSFDEKVGVNEDGSDGRLGLNLTHRVAASIIKYDNEIPISRENGAKLCKGYYTTDAEYVKVIKKAVCGDPHRPSFKTVECQVMDVADDIAYSTYDIDDAFKGGFLSPMDIIGIPLGLQKRVAGRAQQRLSAAGYAVTVNEDVVVDSLIALFAKTVEAPPPEKSDEWGLLYHAIKSYDYSSNHAGYAYYRNALTSQLISRFISGVQFEYNKECPALSRVFLDEETATLVEVLKVYSFESTIMSPRLKVSENRGFDIVSSIFQALDKEDGNFLLPDDFRTLHQRMSNDDAIRRKRVICDFIAGMTDRYAVEFYGRLTGETHRSIFTPL